MIPTSETGDYPQHSVSHLFAADGSLCSQKISKYFYQIFIDIIIDSAYNNNRGCEAYQNRFNVWVSFTADQYAVYKWLGCKCLPLADGAGYKLFGA